VKIVRKSVEFQVKPSAVPWCSAQGVVVSVWRMAQNSVPDWA